MKRFVDVVVVVVVVVVESKCFALIFYYKKLEISKKYFPKTSVRSIPSGISVACFTVAFPTLK